MQKVCAIILRNKKLLMVRQFGRDLFTSVGGKLKEGETVEDCLKREMLEEVKNPIKEYKFFAEVEDKAVLHGNIPLKLSFFIVDVDGEEVKLIDPEVEETKWIDSNFEKQNVKVPNSIKEFVMPKLLEQNLIG